MLAARVPEAAQPFTQLVTTARVSQLSRREMPAAVEAVVARAVEEAAMAICNGRATAAIFISCKAAEFIPSASQLRSQMKTLQPLRQQAEEAVVVAGAAEEMAAQLLPQRKLRALLRLRVA